MLSPRGFLGPPPHNFEYPVFQKGCGKNHFFPFPQDFFLFLYNGDPSLFKGGGGGRPLFFSPPWGAPEILGKTLSPGFLPAKGGAPWGRGDSPNTVGKPFFPPGEFGKRAGGFSPPTLARHEGFRVRNAHAGRHAVLRGSPTSFRGMRRGAFALAGGDRVELGYWLDAAATGAGTRDRSDARPDGGCGEPAGDDACRDPLRCRQCPERGDPAPARVSPGGSRRRDAGLAQGARPSRSRRARHGEAVSQMDER